MGEGGREFSFKKIDQFKQAMTEEELDALSVKSFAETTDKKITWAINMFKEWRMAHCSGSMLRILPTYSSLTCAWLCVVSSTKHIDKTRQNSLGKHSMKF